MIVEQHSTLLHPEQIPDDLLPYPQWGLWRYERAYSGKLTKIPYQITGRKAASDDPATWVPVERVQQAVVQRTIAGDLKYSGIGFVFSPDDPFTGVDLDDCILPDGSLTPDARQIVAALNSYTEISPSGKGLKVWVRGSIPASVKNDAAGVEMYAARRFFTITGNRLQGTPASVNAAEAVLLDLHARFKPTSSSKPVPTTSKPVPTDPFARAMAASEQQIEMHASPAKVEAALQAIRRSRWDDYGQWLDIGMALHSWDSSSIGLNLWDRYSRQSDKYREGECAFKWHGFGGEGITIGTVFGFANEDSPDWFQTYWQGQQAARERNLRAVIGGVRW